MDRDKERAFAQALDDPRLQATLDAVLVAGDRLEEACRDFTARVAELERLLNEYGLTTEDCEKHCVRVFPRLVERRDGGGNRG